MRPVAIIFAKAPVPGRVKTRLQPPLDGEQAAALHHAFVLDLLETLRTLERRLDMEVHTDDLAAPWPERYPRRLQGRGDLGARMLHALGGALAAGRAPAMILGADSPALPASHVESLLDSPADVTLGPAEDGGYYAISCRRIHRSLFRGVRWSHAFTAAETIRAAETCGLSTALGPAWFDVDRPEDLERLALAKGLGRHVRAWMKHAWRAAVIR